MTQLAFDEANYCGTGPENYERFFVPAIGEPLANDLIVAADLKPGEKVLDVACGTGVVTRLAAQQVCQGATVAGLDVNPGMLSVARTVTPKDLAIDWYETSAEAMPLADASFDVVLCQMGLQFIPDKLKALKEIRRILKRGGRVILNLPGPTPAIFVALAEALAKNIDPKCAAFVNVVFSLHDADRLRSLMADAGFSDIEIQKTNRTLLLPAPQDFIWQYIFSTPLAELVGKASADQREVLQDEVILRWQAFAVDGGMTLDVELTTVQGI
ncbi:MAG: methyltransferase domain-containing protein [Pseudomonadota bacterium]|nr:MAG: methyltransferase domain-containing protein [Pseudomonadota bacterium]